MANGWTNANVIRKYSGSYTIVPTRETQTMQAGTLFNQDITVLGDSNLTPANIRDSYTIGGVTGRAQEVSPYSVDYGIFYENDNLFCPYGLFSSNLSNVFRVGNEVICLLSLEKLMHSTDNGKTWTTKSAHSGSSWETDGSPIVAQTSDTKTILAASSYDKVVAYSTDGLIWTQCTYGGAQIKDLCVGNTASGLRWVILDTDSVVYYSTDGKTFTKAIELYTGSGNSYQRVIFWNKTFYIQDIASLSGHYKYSSTDGATWTNTSSASNTFAGCIQGDFVYYGDNNRIYAVGDTRYNTTGYTVETTTDMNTWTVTGLNKVNRKTEGYLAPTEFLTSAVLKDGSTVLIVGGQSLPHMYYGTINDDMTVNWQADTNYYDFDGRLLKNVSNDASAPQYLLLGYGGIYYNSSTENTLSNIITYGNYSRATLDETYYGSKSWYTYGWEEE